MLMSHGRAKTELHVDHQGNEKGEAGRRRGILPNDCDPDALPDGRERERR